jgi:hypothetical protein
MLIDRRKVLLAGAALGLAGCGSSLVGPEPARAQAVSPPTVSRLFVVNAEGGTFADGRLTLTGVHPDTIWFDDRPARGAGRQPTVRFVAEWEQVNGFAQDPPNALLQTGSGQDSQAVVLRSPIWDEASRTLIFDVTVNSGVSTSFPASFGPAALFIDDAGSPTSISSNVLFEMEPAGSVSVQLIVEDAPIRFGIDSVGLDFSLDSEASGFSSVVFDPFGRGFTIQLRSGTCQLSLDLLTTPNIVNFSLVQVFGGSVPVLFQGRALQRTPTVFPWKGTVV